MGCSLWHRSPPTTLALVIAAVAEGAHTSFVAVAGHQAGELVTPHGWAVTCIYRLRPPRIDAPLVPWLPRLAAGGVPRWSRAGERGEKSSRPTPLVLAP